MYSKNVIFLTRILTHYRVPFHQAVKSRLNDAGIGYRLIYGSPSREESKKGDVVDLDWAEKVDAVYLGNSGFVWLRSLDLKSADLVIVGQENRLLNNYIIQMSRKCISLPRKVAYFGHGRNFQAKNPDGIAERFKRLLIRHVDWWFAYTDRSAEVVSEAGFPFANITVFNNSIDTTGIRDDIASINAEDVEFLRRDRFGGSKNIGIYIGGLYDLKRVPFMLEAAERVREAIPDFHLIVIGGGAEFHLVKEAGEHRDWIHPLGPLFGREKALYASLANVFILPGLVGLGVLDAFAYGVPIVTTNLSYHSPEFEYLKNGENGVVVEEFNSIESYSAEVMRVLLDEKFRSALRRRANISLKNYSIESMADRFSDGVKLALAR